MESNLCYSRNRPSKTWNRWCEAFLTFGLDRRSDIRVHSAPPKRFPVTNNSKQKDKSINLHFRLSTCQPENEILKKVKGWRTTYRIVFFWTGSDKIDQLSNRTWSINNLRIARLYLGNLVVAFFGFVTRTIQRREKIVANLSKWKCIFLHSIFMLADQAGKRTEFAAVWLGTNKTKYPELSIRKVTGHVTMPLPEFDRDNSNVTVDMWSTALQINLRWIKNGKVIFSVATWCD